MSEIAPLRSDISVEETQFRSAVSEATLQKIGASINFINTYQEEHKSFWCNGQYNTLSIPFSAIDGLSTKPAISYLAGSFAWCYTGSAFANTTAPVLSVTSLQAGWALRLDILTAQSGSAARGTGLNLNFRVAN